MTIPRRQRCFLAHPEVHKSLRRRASGHTHAASTFQHLGWLSSGSSEWSLFLSLPISIKKWFYILHVAMSPTAKTCQMHPNAVRSAWVLRDLLHLNVCPLPFVSVPLKQTKHPTMDSPETLSHFSPIKAASPDTPSGSIPWDLNNCSLLCSTVNLQVFFFWGLNPTAVTCEILNLMLNVDVSFSFKKPDLSSPMAKPCFYFFGLFLLFAARWSIWSAYHQPHQNTCELFFLPRNNYEEWPKLDANPILWSHLPNARP